MANQNTPGASNTRKEMRKIGFKAYKVLGKDNNGGSNLVSGWVIVRSDVAPRAGELDAGYSTRAEAWRVAEDFYELFRA